MEQPQALTELHVHLEGTVRYETALELARLHRADPPPEYAYSDLAGFFAIYLPVARLLRTADDFERVIVEHAAVMAHEGIAYAEISFNPALHPGTRWLEGVDKGRSRALAEHGVEIRWLVELTRGARLDVNETALEIALNTSGAVGLGLVGDEAVPASDFASLADRAHESGLRIMAHAGQTGGPAVVREAVEVLSVDRIAHGVAAALDRDLCALLSKRDICLCICPSSNHRIGLDPDYAVLAARGIPLSVNTDDPAMVGTSLTAELGVAERQGLDRHALRQAAIAHRFPGPARPLAIPG
jgi:adenosine deaminase